ncbi:MAG: enoyl-CoA hydratase-related protein [Acidimicrobiales bacterium]|jgi:enoyl-CoA hydratase/carnithine racemase|nr:enoyl-CoA hydratase-related protein [Acidimicrobiales bacterium]
MTHDAEVTVEHLDRVAVVRLNRPDRLNAWNNKISAGLDAALEQVSNDPDVRAVIITGTGRAFCAGADLSGGGDTFDPNRTRDSDDTSEERTPQFLPHQVTKPVIAAINGPAVGVGATYPLLCDIRIASESARLGFVFNRIGMLPELGSHSLLPRIVGFSNAAQLLMGGEIIDADTALSMGLVSQVHPDEDLLGQAIALAEQLCSAAPVSVAATKQLLWQGLSLSWEEMHHKETPIFDWIAQQSDSVEGVTAFLEKRNASWSMDPSRDLPKELFD